MAIERIGDSRLKPKRVRSPGEDATSYMRRNHCPAGDDSADPSAFYWGRLPSPAKARGFRRVLCMPPRGMGCWTLVLSLLASLQITLAAEESPQPHGSLSLNGIWTTQGSLDPSHHGQQRFLCRENDECPCCEGGGLQYSSASVGLAGYYFASGTESFQLAAGWMSTQYRWSDNPYYTQSSFPQVWLQFGAETKAFSRWTWTSYGQLYCSVQQFSPLSYGYAQGAFFGRWAYSDQVGLTLGGFAWAGLKYGLILPVLGLDAVLPWQLNLRLIFPLEFSLTRQESPTLRYGLAVRPIFQRNRFAAKDMPCFSMTCADCSSGGCPCAPPPADCITYSLDQGYIEYTNLGFEALVNWWPFFFTQLSLTAGMTTTARLRLADIDNARHFHRYFKPAGYLQGSLTVYF